MWFHQGSHDHRRSPFLEDNDNEHGLMSKVKWFYVSECNKNSTNNLPGRAPEKTAQKINIQRVEDFISSYCNQVHQFIEIFYWNKRNL